MGVAGDRADRLRRADRRPPTRHSPVRASPRPPPPRPARRPRAPALSSQCHIRDHRGDGEPRNFLAGRRPRRRPPPSTRWWAWPGAGRPGHRPRRRGPPSSWHSDDLVPHLRGADINLRLAHPAVGAELALLEAVNVGGTAHLLEAVAEAGVPAVVHASSVGAYSPGDGPVDETWPTGGVARLTVAAGHHEAARERLLDRFEARRPGMCASCGCAPRSCSSGRRRPRSGAFLGPLVPGGLLRPGLVPVLHACGRAALPGRALPRRGRGLRLAATRPVHGASTWQMIPVLDLPAVWALRARAVPVPARRSAPSSTPRGGPGSSRGGSTCAMGKPAARTTSRAWSRARLDGPPPHRPREGARPARRPPPRRGLPDQAPRAPRRRSPPARRAPGRRAGRSASTAADPASPLVGGAGTPDHHAAARRR